MLTEQQIEAAVEWWMQALRDPTFDNIGTRAFQQTFEELKPSLIAQSIARKAKRPDEEKIKKFGDALRELLHAQEDADRIEYIGLTVDYHPCKMLDDALEKIEERPGSMLLLPWKTNMKFRDGGVQVACGYGAPWKEILINEVG